ncbi:DUF308 domain-containing protein [Ruminococcaceae bacterium OttesenSCG-928-I18]|nr:DUF308 domain-containing protein [Ruminococcaceae bacterium OttesenSCG-928-I18]
MESAKRFRVNFIILSLGYILLGVFRILNRDAESLLICYILGGFAIVGGIVRVAFYFLKESGTRIFRNDLALGVLLLFAGIYCILKPETILSLLPVVLGFCVIFDSVLKLEYSFDMKRAVFGGWWFVMVLAVISAICGILLVLGSFSGTVLFYFLGSVLLFDGALNLITLAMLMLVLRHREKHPLPPKEEAAKAAAQESPAVDSAPVNTAPATAQPMAAEPLAPPAEILTPTPGPASPTLEEEEENASS